jgi:hypothetical protein
MVRKAEHQLVCGKRLCRNALQASQNLGRYHASLSVIDPLKTSIKLGTKIDDIDRLPWRIVAGSKITANQFHCATVPDGPNCSWVGGEYERLEAKNRAALQRAGLLVSPNSEAVG